MKTKEDVFQDKFGFGAISDNTSISIAKMNIYQAMEEYAKQKGISFVSWYELSGWIFNPSTGTCKNMKFYDVEEKSFEDLYKEFELTQKV